MILKKSFIVACALSLGACASTYEQPVDSTNFAQLLPGTWLCKNDQDDLKQDIKLILEENGTLISHASFSSTFPKTNKTVSFDLDIEGTWQLEGDIMHQKLVSAELTPTSEYAKSVQGYLKSFLPKENDEMDVRITQLDEKTFIRKNNGSKKSVCLRAED
ncbi:hypothetical protein [Vibrio sinaloensis]|uniref:hypothetical protein n=1 Tax=Photobacterium sp. (strain ATCC 43367) TaxID=379097 RepID=UPI0035E59662